LLALSDLLLLNNAKLDTVTLRKSNHGFSSLTNDKDVGKTGSELVTSSITHVHNIKGTKVTITTDNNTHTTSVVTLGDEAEIANIELNVTNNLIGVQINLNGIIDLDGRIRETDGTSIVSNNEGNLLAGELALDNLAKLVLSLLLIHTMKNKATLHIIQKTETVSTVLKGNNIYT
jgi:hypothetical protein